jgi:hypothetical protein
LARQSAHGASKLSDLASPGNRLGAIAPVLEVVPVTLWGAQIRSAVHPASTIRHHSLLCGLGFFARHLPILSFSNATTARAETPASL